MVTSTFDLPDELTLEIFLRVPTKSIGKFRCVSKQWRFYLSTPQFIKTHFTGKSHQPNLILMIKENDSISSNSNYLQRITTSINDPVCFTILVNYGCFRVMGSCDGLVLLRNHIKELWLVNPITLDRLRVENRPTRFNNKHLICSMSGLGYDSRSDDYKIVVVSTSFVHVYSVKRGVWTRLDCCPYDLVFCGDRSGCFVYGALHWFTDRESGCFIAAFNLANEEFDEVPAPIGFDLMKFKSSGRLMVGGGCLCITENRHHAPSDIWIMKKYGVRESWTKFSIDLYHKETCIALCFMGDDEIVFKIRDDNLVVYNIKHRSLRDVTVNGAIAKFYGQGVGIFVESLLSPFPVSNNNWWKHYFNGHILGFSRNAI